MAGLFVAADMTLNGALAVAGGLLFSIALRSAMSIAGVRAGWDRGAAARRPVVSLAASLLVLAVAVKLLFVSGEWAALAGLDGWPGPPRGTRALDALLATLLFWCATGALACLPVRV